MIRDAHIQILVDKMKEDIDRQLEQAILDASTIGYGFIQIKRLVAKSQFSLRYIPWHQLDDSLRDLGVKNELTNEKKRREYESYMKRK